MVSREMCEDVFSFLRNFHLQEKELFLCVYMRANGIFPFSDKNLS